MTIFEMLQQSAVLTALGMAVVFFFLWTMIIAVNLMSKLIVINSRNSESLQAEKQKTSGAVPHEHIAAITASVTEYRKEA